MKVIIEKVDKNAKTPTKGSASAAGYDLYSAENVTIPWLESRKIRTGLRMEIPEGYFGAIFARSGLAVKRGLRPANCVGVIDSDYRGEIIVALHNDTINLPEELGEEVDAFGAQMEEIKTGDRIAQLVILPYLQAEFEEGSVSETERGSGGFGSTGQQ